MTLDKKNGIILGFFYIVAAVTSIIAVISYDPILSQHWYMTVTDGLKDKVLVGVFNDLLLMLTAVGTAVMLFPYIRRWNEHAALAYLCFRFMEAVFISIGIVSILGLLQMSIQYDANGLANQADFYAAGYMLQGFHRWTSMLGPNLMLGINTVLYSYLLFRTGLVPKPLALFGMVTAVSVFIAGVLEMFGVIEPYSAIKGVIALPVGVFEMTFAGWLIIKGFHVQSLIQLRAISK